jgi:hypothetical protein
MKHNTQPETIDVSVPYYGFPFVLLAIDIDWLVFLKLAQMLMSHNSDYS